MSLNAIGEDIVHYYTKVIILWWNYKINKFKAFSVKLKTSWVNNKGKTTDNLESRLIKQRVKQDIYKNDKKGLTPEQKDVIVGLLLADGFLNVFLLLARI